MHRKARRHALRQGLAHPFFNRLHENARDGATLDHIDKFKPGAACQRLHAQHHFTKLPCPTTLLLVAAVAFSLAGDGFNVGNLRRAGVQLQLELLLHAQQLGTQVHVAQAPDHGLVGARVALHLEAGVFQLQFVQNLKQPLLIALALGLHRQALHGLRQGQRHEVNVVFIV